MTTSTPSYANGETLAPGLRYTEEVGQTARSLPVRYCCLWQEDEPDPVSELEVLSFHQRFGAVAVPAEGIGGAETPPPFRRRGYMRQLLSRAAIGMAQRVNVAFVSEAIEGMYEKFGYHTCLAEGYLSLKVRHVERMLERGALPLVPFYPRGTQKHGGHLDHRTVRAYTPADLPAMVDLYNMAHARRPWTHARRADWDRLMPVQTWAPGSTALVLVEDEQLVGYAIYTDHFYGRTDRSLAVDELAVQDVPAAYRLLAELAQCCWQFRQCDFIVREPLDSVVGFAARQIGCDYHQSYPATGGMMGAILHRESLLAALEPELRRRLPGPELLAEHTTTFPVLLQGELIPDNVTLLRLLLGDWSLLDAQAAGLTLPSHIVRLCAAWFPGGGTQMLTRPYAHKLDRY